MNDVLKRLEELSVVPAIVLDQVDHAVPLAQALFDGGLPCAEVTLRTPAALDVMRQMVGFSERLLVGAGTVLNAKQADEAIDAGAKFIVSPGIDADLVRHCQKKGVLIIPGACTPTEVMLAANLGLECVKFFPAAAYGGLDVIKALNGPFPSMRFMPTGGLSLETFPEYLAYKPVLAVGGTWMLKKQWLETDRFDLVADACATTVSNVLLARRGKHLVKSEK